MVGVALACTTRSWQVSFCSSRRFRDAAGAHAWLGTTVDLAPLPVGAIEGEYDDEFEPITDIAAWWNEVLAMAEHRQSIMPADHESRTIAAAVGQLGLDVACARRASATNRRREIAGAFPAFEVGSHPAR